LLVTDTLVIANPIIKLPKKNFSPRVGLAWDLDGSGKTALRAGFGMYYQMIFREYYLNSRLLPPFYTTLSGEAPSLIFPHPLATLTSGGAVHIDSAQFENHQPYMMQWNLSMQREILPSTVLGLGYVGTRGVYLSRQNGLNTAIPTILEDGRYSYPSGAQRPDRNFTDVLLRELSATSSYNALQLKISRRLSQGLQVQGAYTWSHALDNGAAAISGDTAQTSAPQNPWDLNRSEWSHSPFDLRHVLSINYTFALPLGAARPGVWGKMLEGWQTNGILSATTGVPFSIQNSGGLNRDRGGVGNASRPDGVAGRSNNPTSGVTNGCNGLPAALAGEELGGPDLYYDPCAFRLQDAGFYGNLGRNTVIGPGLMTFDFGLVKNTGLGENRSLQFRWEVFNLFNRPNMGLPNSTAFLAASGAVSATAGRITSTSTDAREMQFALKLSF
jgi:hypothetical protein